MSAREQTYLTKAAGIDPFAVHGVVVPRNEFALPVSRCVLNMRNSQYLAEVLVRITRKRDSDQTDWFGNSGRLGVIELGAMSDYFSLAFTEACETPLSLTRSFESPSSVRNNHNLSGPSFAGSPLTVADHMEKVVPAVSAILQRRQMESKDKPDTKYGRVPPTVVLDLSLGKAIHDETAEVFVVHSDWRVTRKAWTNWVTVLNEAMNARLRAAKRANRQTLFVFWEPTRAHKFTRTARVRDAEDSDYSDSDGNGEDDSVESGPVLKEQLLSGQFHTSDSDTDDEDEKAGTVLTKRLESVVCGPVCFYLYYGGRQSKVFRSRVSEIDVRDVQTSRPQILQPVIRDGSSRAEWMRIGAIHYGFEQAPALPGPLTSVRIERTFDMLMRKFAGARHATSTALVWSNVIDSYAARRNELIARSANGVKAAVRFFTALSTTQIAFALDVTEAMEFELFKLERGNREGNSSVVDINPKLPIAHWMCIDRKFNYRQSEDVTLNYRDDAECAWRDTPGASLLALDHRDLLSAFFSGGEKSLVCLFNLDWGPRKVAADRVVYPLFERRVVPRIVEWIRYAIDQSIELASAPSTFAKVNGRVATFVIPLPAMRRDVPAIAQSTPTDIRHPTAYHGRAVATTVGAIAESIIGSLQSTDEEKKGASVPDNIAVHIVSKGSLSVLFVMVGQFPPTSTVFTSVSQSDRFLLRVYAHAQQDIARTSAALDAAEERAKREDLRNAKKQRKQHTDLVVTRAPVTAVDHRVPATLFPFWNPNNPEAMNLALRHTMQEQLILAALARRT